MRELWSKIKWFFFRTQCSMMHSEHCRSYSIGCDRVMRVPNMTRATGNKWCALFYSTFLIKHRILHISGRMCLRSAWLNESIGSCYVTLISTSSGFDAVLQMMRENEAKCEVWTLHVWHISVFSTSVFPVFTCTYSITPWRLSMKVDILSLIWRHFDVTESWNERCSRVDFLARFVSSRWHRYGRCGDTR